MVYHKKFNSLLKGGSVKELKISEEEKENVISTKDKQNNMSIIPQKHIQNKISQDKLQKFVNLKLNF